MADPVSARGGLLAVAVMLAAAAIAVAPGAAAERGPALGGGSDIAGGDVIQLGQGQSVGPVHYIFADNPEQAPISVRFRAATPPGIVVTPERRAFTIPPGSVVEDHFSIDVGEAVAPGSYPILVSLVRTDVVARPGVVTNVPAIGARFVVRVTGAAGTLQVRAVDTTGAPVEGTLEVAALLEGDRSFEVAQTVGSRLESRLAPGRYEARFLLGGSERATESVDVVADSVASVELAVETISFVAAEARPVVEDGEIVVAELVAALQNALEPLAGPVSLRAVVERDGRRLNVVNLERLERLPLGSTEARSIYRPAAGWTPGTYRVVFELDAPALTLRREATPIEVEERGGRSVLLLAGAALLLFLLLLLAVIARQLRRAPA